MSVRKWVTTLKGLDSLYQEEAALPTPGKGEVLVEVSAVSLNYRDTEGIAGPLSMKTGNRVMLTGSMGYSLYG